MKPAGKKKNNRFFTFSGQRAFSAQIPFNGIGAETVACLFQMKGWPVYE